MCCSLRIDSSSDSTFSLTQDHENQTLVVNLTQTGTGTGTESKTGNQILGGYVSAVGGHVYRKVKEAGLGRHLPTEWFVQDIRD